MGIGRFVAGLLACAPVLALLAPLAFASPSARAAQEAVEGEDLAARIAPILFDRCVTCHGPEQAENGLRLDKRGLALAGGEGGPALVPGDPAQSEIVRRVTATSRLRVMPPPPEAPLSDSERALFAAWIAAGAPWPEPPLAPAAAAGPAWPADDARSILRDACFRCHGSAKQRSGLRLDSRAAALAGGYSGPALVPGDAAASELVRRVESTDPDERMPSEADPLAPELVARLKSWIDAGAPWPEDGAAASAEAPLAGADHWSFQPIARPAIPALPAGNDARNPIDAFVLARLAEAGIEPSPDAPRHTLIRRVSQDLVGLPPTPEEVLAFAADDSPDAYERLVDRLLASPHFGERWARDWLDRARYADSDGYEKDGARRTAWLYRDWVIDAINEDLPFDAFTLQQLAGDLLPNATPREHAATAFHRQTLTNKEGGVDPEQFRVAAVFDRVDTTGSVWLGLTVGCAQCHDHKYDPLSQREYYELFAFFNNADEAQRALPVPEEAMGQWLAEREAWRTERAAVERELEAAAVGVDPGFERWAKEQRATFAANAAAAAEPVPLEWVRVDANAEGALERLEDGSLLSRAAPGKRERWVLQARIELPALYGFRIELLPHESLPGGGPGRGAEGAFVLNELRAFAGPTALEADGVRIDLVRARSAVDAAVTEGGEPALALDADAKTGWSGGGGRACSVDFYARSRRDFDGPVYVTLGLAMSQGDGSALGRLAIRALVSPDPYGELPEGARRSLLAPEGELDEAARRELLQVFRRSHPVTAEVLRSLDDLLAVEPGEPEYVAEVLAERAQERRANQVFVRGDFLRPGAPVEPNVPSVLPPLVPRDPERGADRLDLARWLVDPANPLTARVVANQVWQKLFGRGLVGTANDFGLRGEPPSHPELLDWLASTFVADGWSRKALVRRIVTSAAYRRASDHRPELAELDPDNHLLHRQNRRRLDGELVRDHFLSVAGLLSEKVGGPSVFPPASSTRATPSTSAGTRAAARTATGAACTPSSSARLRTRT